jgi:hypothetical protein
MRTCGINVTRATQILKTIPYFTVIDETALATAKKLSLLYFKGHAKDFPFYFPFLS